ncbi:hypothetical protein F443_15859 [Phytophthora nicotianae P1569]|uniref:Uncharacterized protein n=1 Tax=Phytophthora nicotianae P1569 TaxID=1317065 RepID=V9EGM9_PHYNI|nr:hypothetical protein F443_15859 [Phytophthora nicotianae P1569]
MEGYDWVKLRSEVREIRKNTVNPRSRTTYLNSYSLILAWAAFNRQSYVSGGFIDTIGHVEDYTEQQLCAHVKQKLAQDRTIPPVDFDKLQAQDFVTWLVTLKRRDAGDMHVGRTVAGLPTESSQFSILAPHFEDHEECVKTGVKLMFPGIPERLEFVAEYCLASFVYHYTYLKATLSREHQLFETPLFQDTDLQHQLLSKNWRWKRTISNSPNRNTPARITIVSCLQETGVHGLVQRLANPVQQTQDTTKDNERMLTHFWGGRFRRVPAGFHVPDCSIRQAWILWRCGNEAKRWPPFRLLDGRDVPDRNQQRRLSDLRFVMKKLEHDATSKNLLQDCRSIVDATNVYLACVDSVAVESTTERSRKRRRGQLSWSTVGKLLRQAKKTKRSEG